MNVINTERGRKNGKRERFRKSTLTRIIRKPSEVERPSLILEEKVSQREVEKKGKEMIQMGEQHEQKTGILPKCDFKFPFSEAYNGSRLSFECNENS